jgi:tetratricopeptide (TPR) repeat protein
VWSGIGDSYTELGKHDQAYKSYIEEVALMPQKAAPWCKASLSVHNMGDTILGIEILKLAQNRVDPDGQSGVAFAIGAFYELLDDKDNALIYYMQGQASATKDEDRDVSSKRIYKMLKE